MSNETETQEAPTPEEEPRYSLYPYVQRRVNKHGVTVEKVYYRKYVLKRPLHKKPKLKPKKKVPYNPKYYHRTPMTETRLNLKKLKGDNEKINKVNAFILSLTEASV
jgi:hypothetical protein